MLGTHSQAVEFALKLHDHPEQAYEFLVDWSQGDLARWPDFTEWLERMPLPDDGGVAMLTRDCKRMRSAGTKLAEAALYTVREYDGVHRLAIAASEWALAVANEGDRGTRYAQDQHATNRSGTLPLVDGRS
ncbi:hypothetical protein [Sphingomonas melonis]|uniref:hypothetical protein n=1 Tax=Sphingomonas melonis TaxID=152682 RepID=UPI0035C84309